MHYVDGVWRTKKIPMRLLWGSNRVAKSVPVSKLDDWKASTAKKTLNKSSCQARFLPEVGKATLKSNGDEALSDEFLLKRNGDEALFNEFLLKSNRDEAVNDVFL